MARRAIEEIADELAAWLPNYGHGEDDFPTLLLRILASLPGGDRLEDVGYSPFRIGWYESGLLARVIDAIDDKRDVEDLVDALLDDEDE